MLSSDWSGIALSSSKCRNVDFRGAQLNSADLWHTEFESLRDLAWRELFAEFAIELTHYGLLDPTSRELIDPVTSFNLQHIAA